MDPNPFQAPMEMDFLTRPTIAGQYERDKMQLIVDSGAVLPLYCVKTGEPISEADMKLQKLVWCPLYVIIVFVLSRLIGIIVYFIVRKKCEITFGLSPAIRRKYRTRQLTAFLAVMLGIAGLFLGANMNNGGVIILGAIVLILIAIVVLLVSNSALSAAKHVNGKFWIKGCSPAFLDRIAS